MLFERNEDIGQQMIKQTLHTISQQWLIIVVEHFLAISEALMLKRPISIFNNGSLVQLNNAA